MSPHPTTPEPETAADQRTEDAQYYRGTLHALIDLGMIVARRVAQQADAPVEAAAPGADDAAPAPVPDLTLAFERVSRSIRRCILLAQKVAEWAAVRDAGTVARSRAGARKRILRAVEDMIERMTGEHEGGALHAELLDRLDSPDLDDDIDHRPVADIIEEIQRDLGVIGGPDGPYWKRRTPADIAVLCARAAAPPGKAWTVPAQPRDDQAYAEPDSAVLRPGTRFTFDDG